MPAKNHVHKYHLIRLGSKKDSKKVYACALPECTHYQPSKNQVVGKKSICWKCEDEFIISKDVTRFNRVKPKCNKCRGKVKKDVSIDRAIDMLTALRGL